MLESRDLQTRKVFMLHRSPGFASASIFALATASFAVACSSQSTPAPDENVDLGSIRVFSNEVPACDDGIPNGKETDVDCGGPCGKCEAFKGCQVAGDCNSAVCRDSLCQVAHAGNLVKDADETDIDCGGADAPGCAAEAACKENHDCESNLCNIAAGKTDGKCAAVPPAVDDPPITGQSIRIMANAAGVLTVPADAKSCVGAGPGHTTCGAGAESCCGTIGVPAGSYKRYSKSNLPATVSAFNLDKFEVTQGRLRTFIQSKGGNLKGSPPAAGAGKHPKIANSGWRSEWNKRLPASNAEVNARFTYACAYGSDNSSYGSTTWTTNGTNDDKPVTCVDWYTAFAFCAWDGGRLPTDAEWGYAAQGGSEQRTYTWGNAAVKAEDANSIKRVVHYLGGWQMTWPLAPPEANQYWNGPDGPKHIAPPGKKTAGKARWGHMDLNGNVLEWMLDNNDAKSGNCVDCANVSWPALAAGENSPQPINNAGTAQWKSDGGRVLRGGSFELHPLQNTHRYVNYPVWRTYARAGFRCARD